MEYTFALIKSNVCYAHAIRDIVGRIERAGLTVIAAETRVLTEHDIKTLYCHHVGKPYWDDLETSVSRGVYAMVLKGEDAISSWRLLMGATNPREAAEHTIRYDYGLRNGPMADNAVHGSDSVTAATLEIAYFFPDVATNLGMLPLSM